MKREVRAGDGVYRYGGEEFLLVLPEQVPETARVAVDRVRAAVEQLGIPHPAAPAGRPGTGMDAGGHLGPWLPARVGRGGDGPARRQAPPARASLISSRWPSGSRRKARTSQPWSTGGVRNCAPRARNAS